MEELRIRVIGGRFSRRGTALALDFQCVIELRVQCPCACVLSVDMAGGFSWFDAIVDGQVQSTVQSTGSRAIFDFDLPDALGETTVWLVKRTEPWLTQLFPPLQYLPLECSTSTAVVYGVSVSENSTICEPPPPAARRIEFVGDSDCAAFGGEGEATELSLWGILKMSNSTQNVSNSWAHILSRMLDAEPSVVACSGIGVHTNAEHCDPPGTSAAMEAMYRRSVASDPDSQYTFDDAWQPQLVTVDVGSNDLFGGRTPPSKQQFVNAYVSLLATIRRNRPSAIIICIASSLETPGYIQMGAADGRLWEHISEAVRVYIQQSGDKRTFATQPVSGQQWPQDGGSLEHWNTNGHRKLADALCTYLEKGEPAGVLGWQRSSERGFPLRHVKQANNVNRFRTFTMFSACILGLSFAWRMLS